MSIRTRPLALASVLAVALALGPEAAGSPREDRAQADRLFAAGVGLLQQGDVEGALREFVASRGLRETASVVFNIAGCYRTLGRRVEAREAYHRVVEIARRGPQRTRAERALREVEAQLAFVTVRPQPADADVSIDGHRVAVQPVALEPGTAHDVEVRRPGHRTIRHRLEPAAAGPTELVLVLEPSVGDAAASPEPAPTPTPTARTAAGPSTPPPGPVETAVPLRPEPASPAARRPPPGTTARARESSGSPWPWILGGAGVVVAGVVVTALVLSSGSDATVEGDFAFYDVP